MLNLIEPELQLDGLATIPRFPLAKSAGRRANAMAGFSSPRESAPRVFLLEEKKERFLLGIVLLGGFLLGEALLGES